MSTGQPASKLIYPLSHFGVAWILTTALLLAYTAIVTPPMISFHWTGAFADHAHHSFLPASFCNCSVTHTQPCSDKLRPKSVSQAPHGFTCTSSSNPKQQTRNAP